MPYESKLACADADTLFEAILSLRNAEECYRFFSDLCTVKELRDMCQRFHIAKLLDQKVSFQIIMSQIPASTATIGRVNRSLKYGENGYQIVLPRLKKPASGR
ncbi:MAG: YerC/YecD family TrpR-related protein [Candidatus Izemoplasmatales bacterium]